MTDCMFAKVLFCFVCSVLKFIGLGVCDKMASLTKTIMVRKHSFTVTLLAFRGIDKRSIPQVIQHATYFTVMIHYSFLAEEEWTSLVNEPTDRRLSADYTLQTFGRRGILYRIPK